MLCKLGVLRRARWALVAAGLVTLLFGLYLYFALPGDEHNLVMLSGMFCGAGVGVLCVGALSVMQNKRMTPEQKKQADIERRDERNAAIQGKVFLVSGCVAAGFSVVAAFVLVGLGYRMPAYLMLGGLYLQLLTMLGAEWYYRKRM